MGSIVHVDEAKKELMKDVHYLARLGVKLGYSNDVGIHVHNRDKSPLVEDSKAKQDLNL